MRYAEIFENMPPSAIAVGERLRTAQEKKINRKKLKHIEAECEFLDSLQFDVDGRVFMFRKMIVSPDYVKELLNGEETNLGFHWASSESEAFPYSYEGSRQNMIEILLCATVSFDAIQWDECVARVDIGESEIMPFAESDLILKSLKVAGKSLKLPPNLPIMHP